MDNQLAEQLLEYVRNRYFGKYRGIVTDNQDPTHRGRVKVRVPAVFGPEVNVWAVPCLPYAGKNVGVYMVPEPGAGVWVEFEAGDPSFPIWSGGYWVDGELPENEAGAAAVPSRRTIRSEKGMMVSLDDEAHVVTISDNDGSNLVTIQVQQGKIRIKGNLKVVVEAPQIELVENSTHPLVFGDNLLNYLNQLVQVYQTHTHPGEMALGVLPVTPAPPVPPLPPATPDLLSVKVKTG